MEGVCDQQFVWKERKDVEKIPIVDLKICQVMMEVMWGYGKESYNLSTLGHPVHIGVLSPKPHE